MSDRNIIGRRSLTEIFRVAKPLVGMVHLLPLPGSPRWAGSLQAVVDHAVADGRSMAKGGMDGVIVENFLDAPFYADRVGPETIAAMARIGTELSRVIDIPIGINVLRNDSMGALAVAAATGGSFIRVNVHTGAMWTDQGWIQGRAETTLRARRRLDLPAAILADVFVKHGSPPAGASFEEAARDCWERGLADGLIVTGTGTGQPTSEALIETLKSSLPDAPIWVGSGATVETAAALLERADGLIIGSALTVDGRAGSGVAPDRVAALVQAARG